MYTQKTTHSRTNKPNLVFPNKTLKKWRHQSPNKVSHLTSPWKTFISAVLITQHAESTEFVLRELTVRGHPPSNTQNSLSLSLSLCDHKLFQTGCFHGQFYLTTILFPWICSFLTLVHSFTHSCTCSCSSLILNAVNGAIHCNTIRRVTDRVSCKVKCVGGICGC